jgi:hypothetical protein
VTGRSTQTDHSSREPQRKDIMQVDWKLSLTATEVTEARIKSPAKLGVHGR